MSAEWVTIGDLQPHHIDAVSEVHFAAFEESGLSALGEGAVRRFYAWVLETPMDRVALGAFDGSRLVGFCIAGRISGAVRRFAAENRPFLALCLIRRPWLVVHASARKRVRLLIEWLWIRTKGLWTGPATGKPTALPSPHGRAVSPSGGSHPPETFGVLAIATSPERQRAGVGRRLMDALEEAARQRGFIEMYLFVKPSNTAAIRFYEGLGWKKRSVAGTWYGEMIRTISP